MSQNQKPSTSRATVIFRKWILPWLALSLAILFGVYAAYLYFAGSHKEKKPIHLVVTAGNLAGTRGKIAQLLHAGLEENQKITFEIVPSAGSVEAIAMVDEGKIDLALVQGGLKLAGFRNVKLAAVLHIEPLHLLIKGGQQISVESHLDFLRGKRVNMGVEGSGTRKFAQELLAFANLTPEIDFESTSFSYSQLVDMDPAELPDAVFSISSQPSPVIANLITQKGYRLVSLPYSDSMRINGLYNAQSEIDRRQIEVGTVPPYLYSLDPPRPEVEIETLGVPLLVIANKECDEDGIRRICEFVYDGGFSNSFDGNVEPNKMSSITSSNLHSGTQQYLYSKKPASTQQVIEITDQLVAIAGSSLGTILFLWQWIKRRREKRRDLEFVQHIERVVEIENYAIQYETLEEITVDSLLQFQNELVEIKTDLIKQYKSGNLEGADMLSAFLKHVNDTSELISRIVLHELEPKNT